MEQRQQVFFSVKRSVDTIDGQIINYLQTNPFDLGALPEIVMLTLKEYWSPFAICANGVDGETLRQRAIWSIKQLEAQAALIRETFLVSQQVETFVVSNGADADDDSALSEDNDDLTNIEIPLEVQQINNLFQQ